MGALEVDVKSGLFGHREGALVGEYPGFKKAADHACGWLKIGMTEMPGQAVSKMHSGGGKGSPLRHPAFESFTLVCDGSFCQPRAFTPVDVNILYHNGVSFSRNGDIDTLYVLLNIDLNDVIFSRSGH